MKNERIIIQLQQQIFQFMIVAWIEFALVCVVSDLITTIICTRQPVYLNIDSFKTDFKNNYYNQRCYSITGLQQCLQSTAVVEREQLERVRRESKRRRWNKKKRMHQASRVARHTVLKWLNITPSRYKDDVGRWWFMIS